uniref:Serpin domain-containing protein n=1 Tax=Oryza meridionalis TaxID=40149 RepID=A0A0E0F3X2_9ORYZ
MTTMEDAGDRGMTAFALCLAKHLAGGGGSSGNNNKKNIVFSPMSLGTTLDELLALHCTMSLDDLTESIHRIMEVDLADESASGGPPISYACNAWHDETLTLSVRKKTEFSSMEAWARLFAGSGLAALSMRLTKQLSTGGDHLAAAGVQQNGGASKAGPSNLVFSPLSIYSALSVVAAGARGRTQSELLKALGAGSREELAESVAKMMARALPDGAAQRGGPRVAHACAIWHERARMVKPAFRDAAAASFKAVTRAVDFLRNRKLVRRSTDGCRRATENLIDSIVSPDSVDKNTRLVVTSAVYFKGRWARPFDKEKTKKDKFHLLDGGGDVDADFMRSGEDQYIAVHRGFKVLRMPYAAAQHEHNRVCTKEHLRRRFAAAAAAAVVPKEMPATSPRYSMCVFLPDERDGLWKLEDRMAAGGEGFLRKHMPERRVKVGEFRIPRFKLSFGDSVVRALRGLGVRALFDPARAELTDVLEADNSGDPPLFVSDVVHRAVIEVNEEGTEAAAATAMILLGAAPNAAHRRHGWTSSPTIRSRLLPRPSPSNGEPAAAAPPVLRDPGFRGVVPRLRARGACARRRRALPRRPPARPPLPLLSWNWILLLLLRLIPPLASLVAASSRGDREPSTTEACSRRCAASGLTGISLRLAEQFSAEEDGGGGGGNLVFSPLSIYSALSVVTAGARGTTLTELLAALGAPSRDALAKNAAEIARALAGGTATGGPRVAHACGLWHERTRSLKLAFRDAAAASFNAATRAVDFLANPEEARKEINSWVAAATENLIDTILPPGSVSTDTGLVVTSAIYFNGTWQTPFRKQDTKKDKFHLLDGHGTVDADFMRTGEDQYIAAHDGFKVLKMPYAHDNAAPQPSPRYYSMYILLPDERDGLSSLEDRMAAAGGGGGGEGFLREHMPVRRVEVGEFRIPRFKLSFSRSVVRALRGVGVNAVFDRAELPDMIEGEPLRVSDVLHKAVIEVNEEGTEAAAATVVIMKGRARRPSPAAAPVDFVADHPFAFFVVEESSGAVLFAGHVAIGCRSGSIAFTFGVLGVASYDELAGLVGRLAGKALADLSGTGGPCVSFVSAVWHDMARTLAPSFRAAAVLSFMAETHAVDMRSRREAVGQINAWAKKATNELIDSVIDGELPADADVVVTNAVYFKGKFTITDKFHRLGAAAAVDARFMRSTLPRHHIACHDGFKVLRLPFVQGRRPPWSPPSSRFSMCVFLPDERDGLWDLLDEMASAPGFLQAALPTKTVRVGKFMLPKFKLTFSDDIAGVLRGMGLDVTFSDGVADFSKMVEDGGGRPLSMRSVVHKAVIEVNEEGTEAAAVTAGTLCLASAKRPRPVVVDFVADHPFAFFVIEETTGAVVFAGHLALSLARRIQAGGAPDGNLVFSPLSVYAALALVAAGAGGDTLAELLGVLGAGSRDELAGLAGRLAGQALADRSRAGGPRVSFVSGVWHDKTRTLSPSFRDAAVQSFMAETRAADFREKPGEAVNQINAWARKATNKLIDSVIDGGLPADNDVVVANAVYFKGKWKDPFTKALTKTGKFHRLDGAAVDASFMQRGTYYDTGDYIACHDGFKVLRLPYDDERRRSPASPPPPPSTPRFSLCVFLPDARDGLWDLLDEIASTPGFLQAKLPTRHASVGEFKLPKFKLTFSGDIAGVLRGLGLDATFSDGEADFSKMVEDDGGRRPLSMRSLVHKAVIEVNEEGTEAAASALNMVCGMSMTPEPPPVVVDFVADHPFAFFVIEETTGAVVFAGHVLDPSSTAGALDDDDDDDDEFVVMGCLRYLLDRCMAFLGV